MSVCVCVCVYTFLMCVFTVALGVQWEDFLCVFVCWLALQYLMYSCICIRTEVKLFVCVILTWGVNSTEPNQHKYNKAPLIYLSLMKPNTLWALTLDWQVSVWLLSLVKHQFKAFNAHEVLYQMNVNANFLETVQEIYCQCLLCRV